MPVALDDFLDELDEVSEQVASARHEDFPRELRRWFAVFEDAPPPVVVRLRWLMGRYTWVGNERELTKENSGMGPSKLLWPDDKERRLSAQLNLFKEFAEERIEAWNFAFDYFGTSSNNIDDTLHEMTSHLFAPHVAELRRYLIRTADDPIPSDPLQFTHEIPASDRIVRLDHNHPAYLTAIGAIELAEQASEESNAIGPDDRERIKFELDAGILLLKASTARVNAIEAVLIRALRWLSENFAGAALGIAAERALTEVIKLINGAA